MTDIRITESALDGAVAHLRFVVAQLGAADGTSEAAAAAVGHEGLAHRVRASADSWDDTRERFRDAAERLADRVEGIGAGFDDADRRLAGG